MPRRETTNGGAKARPVAVVAGIVFVCFTAVGSAVIFDLHVNWTAAMPKGICRSVEPSGQRGESVAICLEGEAASMARDCAYVIAGSCPVGIAAVFKQVRGVSGDRIKLDSSGVTTSELEGKMKPESEVLHAKEQGARVHIRLGVAPPSERASLLAVLSDALRGA